MGGFDAVIFPVLNRSRMDLQRVGLGIALSTSLALGCGFRSDPLIPEGLEGGLEESDDGGLTVDRNRPGSCNDRLPFPTMDSRVTGELPPDGSLSAGWCRFDDEEEDPTEQDRSGPEDAYVFVPEFTTDVTVRLDTAATEFDATLRVESGGCGAEGDQLVCDNQIDDGAFHFLAEAGKEYTVTIDAQRRGDSGAYAFDVTYGFPGLELCPVHPETITQVSGATFIWENNLSGDSQGRVDGFCGGPGKENMFTLNTSYAGFIYMTVTGSSGFSPVVSLRTSCAATSELACARDGDTGIPDVAELEAFIEGPGQYFIVVDQTGIDGGAYRLDVFFD